MKIYFKNFNNDFYKYIKMQKERFIMKNIGEEVAYLKGLAEGQIIDDKSKKAK